VTIKRLIVGNAERLAEQHVAGVPIPLRESDVALELVTGRLRQHELLEGGIGRLLLAELLNQQGIELC
jgi:hypothetical protein